MTPRKGSLPDCVIILNTPHGNSVFNAILPIYGVVPQGTLDQPQLVCLLIWLPNFPPLMTWAPMEGQPFSYLPPPPYFFISIDVRYKTLAVCAYWLTAIITTVFITQPSFKESHPSFVFDFSPHSMWENVPLLFCWQRFNVVYIANASVTHNAFGNHICTIIF